MSYIFKQKLNNLNNYGDILSFIFRGGLLKLS